MTTATTFDERVLSPDALDLHSLVARFRSVRIDTRYYAPGVHRASFALPAIMKNLVAGKNSRLEACPAEGKVTMLSP